MKKVGLALIALLFLSGCQTMQTQEVVKRQVAFPESEYAALEMSGDSTVRGQVFMTTRGGDVKYGAGREVVITPVTSYTSEATRVMLAGKRIEDPDPRAQAFTRRTIADGSGNFEFNGLPAGRYYVAGSVVWEVPSQFGPARQGGAVLRQISVGEGETETVMLNR
ncbi:carboxypeptidase regulatory-like domain-containing protein [Halomonas sp. M5N1S17]|uniref:carboxypeptidase regulatory-like domain-containing protein n=1 Tax=Halomonas alkalisoli TaxID=2907158 RepID=UPI001F456B63|nr:carboxypeptidase regulatory-like domain-containing protein [Halomonas alkalisoli]MCE9664527.1 carboxypeptidase regulatory-like domain-containing protein [Halomonas alkalisoli]